jgi:hypothetical protein
MKHLSKTILVALASGVLSCALFTQQTQATTIQGRINLVATVMFNTNSQPTATEVLSWYDINNNAGKSSVARGTTGTFMAIPVGTQAIMAPTWTFGPSTPTPLLWSVGGFTFDLLSATIVTQTKSFLNVTGTGIVQPNNGSTATFGTWSFTARNSSGKPRMVFSFVANAASVPDGGSAVALLGIALTGIEVLRRRLRNGQG